MAVPVSQAGGDTLDAFVRDKMALWNTGVVSVTNSLVFLGPVEHTDTY